MKKLIIQQVLTVGGIYGGEFDDMMRLTYQRHKAYARAQGFDYWHICGTIFPDMRGGGWDKIDLIRRAMELNYEFSNKKITVLPYS